MSVNKFIKDVLYTRERVIVQDLGAFIRQTELAKVGENKDVIFPPKTIIQFDSSEKISDGVLENFIVQNGKLNPEQTQKFISDYVVDLKNRLQNGEIEEIEHLGVLKMESEALVFTADVDSSFVLNTALSELKVNPLPEQEIVAQTENTSKRPSIGIWIGIAAAVIIVLLLVFPVRNYLNQQKLNAEKEKIAQAERQEEAKLEAQAKREADLEKAALEAQKEKEKENEKPKLRFHIVAGSFKTMANAETLKVELTKKGYSAIILPQDGDLIRVSMVAFEKRKQAEKEMKKINLSEAKYDIWLYEIK